MVCRYSNCIFGDNREIPCGTEVLINKTYYHPECAYNKKNIAESIDLFVNHINKNVVYPQLIKVINDIVFKKDIDSGMLLFGIKLWISKRKNLNYPGGLYYVIQDVDVQKGWTESQAKKVKQKMISSDTVEERQIQNFGYVKKRAFSSIADLMEV